ncbi:tRNA (uridine(54)-C5)-methyltransferase TrmA [Dasania marina]|uniref:tRNA (uridine(54)-C5)-methyltransferase TrmA n=1 Tax=Dasania marina TaxID=471499 RepID=UPI0030D86EDC|tara:strand:- start:69727 stop:70815 length:1089 start_codon:yes stop_codon:yes gene_type:complete
MPLSNINPDNYQQQLDAKAQRVSQLFSEFTPPALEVYPSPPLHFRMRAEFKIWHKGEHSHYAMFKKETPKQPQFISDFPIGSKTINQLMPELMAAIKAEPLLRKRLFQVEFLTTLSGQALITLIYHKKLDEAWQSAAELLQQQLGAGIIGRSKKQKLVLKDDYITETLDVSGQRFHFQQVESGFTQPNAKVNEKMLGWALQHSQNSPGDLLELYCGNGNFTAVLAQNFDKVLATEIAKTSVRSAEYNFKLNNINNIKIARMSSEEFSSALMGEREYRRLADIDLASYNISTVLVDPPRAGLDDNTIKLISQYSRIIYISCNPNTLHDNMKQLSLTHDIAQFAIFDQFPYTDHIESGLVLVKR